MMLTSEGAMAKQTLGKSQVRALRNAFRVIERTLVQVSQLASPQPVAVEKPSERTLRLSPARRAQLKLQGQYMGFSRQLKPKEKARIKAVKEKSGYPAAIKLAKQLASQ